MASQLDMLLYYQSCRIKGVRLALASLRQTAPHHDFAYFTMHTVQGNCPDLNSEGNYP